MVTPLFPVRFVFVLAVIWSVDRPLTIAGVGIVCWVVQLARPYQQWQADGVPGFRHQSSTHYYMTVSKNETVL
jgi:hypothetical protein